MKLLTLDEFRKISDHYFEEVYFNIISENTKILSDIFDEKNQKFCPDCFENFKDEHVGYKYEIIEGKRRRVQNPPIKTKIRECGCCKSCKNSKGHYRYPTDGDAFYIHTRQQKIMKNFIFDADNGFFNLEVKSCSIPREFRSSTCLSHTCSALKLTNEEYNQVHKSVKIIEAVKRTMQMPY